MSEEEGMVIFMSSTFWTNTIWYILLGIIAIIVFVFAMFKAEKKKPALALFLIVYGIILNFETAILILLKSYTYYPMVFKTAPNPINDSLLGNIFSQFSVSATILLAVILNLKPYWYFIIAIIFGGIEELFLALGIYSHNWYRTWMTVVLLPFAIWVSKKIYRQLIQGIKPAYYYPYIFIGLFPLYVTTIMFVIELSGYWAFKKDLFQDPIHSYNFLGLALFFTLPSIIMMLIHYLRIKWHWKALGIPMLYTIYYLCIRYNWLWIKEGWFLPITTIIIVWIYLSVLILDWLYGGKSLSEYSPDKQ